MRVSIPLGDVVDAATTPISPISRDRAVDEGQRPSIIVVDAATISESTGHPRLIITAILPEIVLLISVSVPAL